MLFYYLLRLLTMFPATAPVQPVFQAQIIDSMVSIGYGVALGDVDGDGKPDILLADKKQFVWYRNGDWKRFVMAENLTEYDNVCIAAMDVTGDGKVEVAVGAQWNPSETGSEQKSGAVFYLERPKDPTQLWKPVELHHEVTTHRMKWARTADGKYYLIVLPLHGKDNQGGSGAGVKILAYQFPPTATASWKITTLDTTLHLTHNFDIPITQKKEEQGLYVASKEGIKFIAANFPANSTIKAVSLTGMDKGAGEIRIGKLSASNRFIATVEPMHGQEVVVYLPDNGAKRILLDDNVKEGHALAVADFSGSGIQQIVAGWRVPNKDGKVGVKIYSSQDASGANWQSAWIDENGMACEDLQVMDMNGDGKLDIIASGRSTKNLKIYWNK